MHRVDYEEVAASYDRRYAANDYADVARCLRNFLGNADAIAEVGCGTGHWLALATAPEQHPLVAGLDRAWAMLERAKVTAPSALCVRGTADRLPWRRAVFDRVFCVNALHHFSDPSRVFHECGRVLRDDGAFLTIGLDPSTSRDRWWIYDYFPAARVADLQRYPSSESIRAHLAAAGFVRITTIVAQHIPARITFEDAEARGFLDRQSTSQLLVIDDRDWASGLSRLRRDKPVLEADLRLYATIGWRG